MKFLIIFISIIGSIQSITHYISENLFNLQISLDKYPQLSTNSYAESPEIQHTDSYMKTETPIQLTKGRFFRGESPRFFDVSFEKDLKIVKYDEKSQNNEKHYTLKPKYIDDLVISPEKKLINTLNGIVEDIDDHMKGRKGY